MASNTRIGSKALSLVLLPAFLIMSGCSKEKDSIPEPVISFALDGMNYSYPVSTQRPSGEMKFEFIDFNKNNVPEVIELEKTTITIDGEGPIRISFGRSEIMQFSYGFGPGGLSDIIFDFEPSGCPTYSFETRFSSPETIVTFNTIELGDLIEKSDPVPPDIPLAPTIYEIYKLNKLDVDFIIELESLECDGSQVLKLAENGKIIINPT